MTSKAAYDALAKELAAAESQSGLYLADENVDMENVIDAGHEYGSDDYWISMLQSAQMAAGCRAENEGFNINKLIGRVIY